MFDGYQFTMRVHLHFVVLILVERWHMQDAACWRFCDRDMLIIQKLHYFVFLLNDRRSSKIRSSKIRRVGRCVPLLGKLLAVHIVLARHFSYLWFL